MAVDALPASTRAFRFQVDERMADGAYVQGLTGGHVAAGWNLRDPKITMVPGMKVAFFGVAEGCDAKAANGPVVAGDAGEFAAKAALTGVSAQGAPDALRWTPSGNLASCDSATQSRTGPNWIFVNPAARGGGVGMYTQVGPENNGRQPFLTATSAGGIDGAGYNGNGLANFVAFRMAWNAADAVRPWLSDGHAAEARIVSTQSMGATQTQASTGQTIQVKQQVMVSLINTECQKGLVRPCQIQYLINTAAVRSGVSNWEAQSPAQRGRVWFDKVQANLPIVAGLLPEKGRQVVDQDSGLTLYRSEGAPSQHGQFSGQNFDVRIGFEQLMNAARIVAARGLGVAPDLVNDEQMAERWTAHWNDPAAWTLVATTFGHEIYNNAAASTRSYIGGGFSSLYVGPAR